MFYIFSVGDKNINNQKPSKLKNIKINNCLYSFKKTILFDNYNNFKIIQKIDENLLFISVLVLLWWSEVCTKFSTEGLKPNLYSI